MSERKLSMTKSLHQVAIFVNTACSDQAATLCSMNSEKRLKKAQGKRLAVARKAAGFRSARSAALEFEWPESTYRAHEAGGRTIGQDDADRYALAFRARGAAITGKQILYGDGESEASSIIRVPLLDFVTAGKLAFPSSQIPVEDVPLLAFADLGPGEWFALRVSGDSMNKVSPDGSIIVVNRADTHLVSGKCYVFAIKGETTYKRWQGGDQPFLEAYSTETYLPIFPTPKKDFAVVGRVKRTVLDL